MLSFDVVAAHFFAFFQQSFSKQVYKSALIRAPVFRNSIE